MREAAVPDYRLSKAKRSTRILITLGLLGILLGLLSALLLTIVKTGIVPTDVAAYYLGTDIGSDSGALNIGSGPRPLAELAEVTHLHLVGGAMLLFFLCHLLALCEIADSTRVALYLTAFISFIATFASPWLIVFVHPVFSYLFSGSIIVLIFSLIITSAIPISEMWR